MKLPDEAKPNAASLEDLRALLDQCGTESMLKPSEAVQEMLANVGIDAPRISEKQASAGTACGIDGAPDWLEDPFDLNNDDVLCELSEAETISETLDWFYRYAQKHLIHNVRYYFLYSDHIGFPWSLASIESKGHDAEITRKFRYGLIRREADGAQSDSFLCIEHRETVLCRVDQSLEHPRRIPGPDKRIISYGVPNACPEFGDGERLYGDFLLTANGRVIGKLSCDFVVNDPELIDIEDIRAIERLAMLAALRLDALRSSAASERRRGFRKLIREHANGDKLWSFVRKQLPGRIPKCTGVAYFDRVDDFVPDVSGSPTSGRVWLLRVSSDPDHRHLEMRKCFRANSNREIISVAAQRRESFWFADLANMELTESQCRNYGLVTDSKATLNWEEGFFPWKSLGNAFIVPMTCPVTDDVIGVFVFWNQRRQAKRKHYFTRLDQDVIVWIVNECLAVRLVNVDRVDAHENPRELSDFAVQVGKSFLAAPESAGFPELATLAVRMLQDVIPERGSEKLYGICQADVGAKELEVIAIAGGLDNSMTPHKRFRLPQTITQAAISQKDGGVVFRAGRGERLTPRAKFEMGCPILTERGAIGAVVVKSEEHDLRLNVDGEYLKIVAAWLGDALRSRSLFMEGLQRPEMSDVK